VNRWLRPDSVRHMSVTTAMQGLTAAHRETQRDNRKMAREPGYAQARGCFRWWWQVLGSNQRRLSRRFYRPLVLICLCTFRPAHIWPTVIIAVGPVRHMSVRAEALIAETTDRHGQRPCALKVCRQNPVQPKFLHGSYVSAAWRR